MEWGLTSTFFSGLPGRSNGTARRDAEKPREKILVKLLPLCPFSGYQHANGGGEFSLSFEELRNGIDVRVLDFSVGRTALVRQSESESHLRHRDPDQGQGSIADNPTAPLLVSASPCYREPTNVIRADRRPLADFSVLIGSSMSDSAIGHQHCKRALSSRTDQCPYAQSIGAEQTRSISSWRFFCRAAS